MADYAAPPAQPGPESDHEKIASRALILLREGRYNEAIACYDELLRRFPNYVDGWYNKGIALGEHLQDYEHAIYCYDRGLQLNPQDIDMWHNKGKALYCLGRNVEAVQCFDRVLQLNPHYRISLEGKAAALNNMGRFKEAQAVAEHILEMYPPRNIKTWKALSVLAMALNNQNLHKKAIEAANKAIALNPNDDGIWETKGAALAAMGRYREALQCLEEALKLNPHNRTAEATRDKVAEILNEFWSGQKK
jgi:tetratricopeptide (TPR) repeat protein